MRDTPRMRRVLHASHVRVCAALYCMHVGRLRERPPTDTDGCAAHSYALVLSLLAIRIRLNIVSRHYLVEMQAASGSRSAAGLSNMTKRRFLSTEHLYATYQHCRPIASHLPCPKSGRRPRKGGMHASMHAPASI